MESGAKYKVAGNTAFGKKDRGAAVEAYSQAIESHIGVLSQKPDDREEREARKQVALCYVNRAVAFLTEGDGLNAERALDDSKSALSFYPGYAKA